jgi:hypothetical protein
MKVGEYLYFAPGLAFANIDFRLTELPRQYQRRIEGYYLKPAEYLINEEYGFGAGLLILCAIDALGKVDYPISQVADRFKAYCQKRLISFSNEELAGYLYDAFRCGIVHEARVKDGAEFSLESKTSVEYAPGGVRVNPVHLLSEVRAALDKQMREIESNQEQMVIFKEYVLKQFSHELQGIYMGH